MIDDNLKISRSQFRKKNTNINLLQKPKIDPFSTHSTTILSPFPVLKLGCAFKNTELVKLCSKFCTVLLNWSHLANDTPSSINLKINLTTKIFIFLLFIFRWKKTNKTSSSRLFLKFVFKMFFSRWKFFVFKLKRF